MASGHAQPSAAFARPSTTASASPPAVTAETGGHDALSDVLRAVRLRGAVFFLVDGSSPYAVEAPDGGTLAAAIDPGAQQIVSYHLVTAGGCWCVMEGSEPVRLETGDVLVVPHGDPYRLASSPGLRPAVPREEVQSFFRMAAARELPFVVVEGGGEPPPLGLVCGFLACDTQPFNPVLEALPRLLRVASVGDGRLNQLVALAVTEARERRPGSDCVLLRLSELLFVEVVRRHLAAAPAEQQGWLAALGDPCVGRALALLHARPAAAWTLGDLAHASCLSRSALAARFTALVGRPPMQYLGRWRMQLAARLLADGGAKVAAVAAAVGYESEAAFSRAFKRAVGMPPAAWRSRR